MEVINLNRFLPGDKLFPLRNLFPLINHLSWPVLLESSYLHPEIGRYSILTAEPYLIFKADNKKAIVETKEKKEIIYGNPLKILEETWLTSYIESDKKTALPFVGGAIGYFSYDLKDYIEKLPSLAKDDLKVPLIYLGFYGWAIVSDHLNQQTYLVVTNKSSLSSEEIIKTIKKNSTGQTIRSFKAKTKKSFKSNFTKKKYLEAVKKAIEYIYAGDIFQVNLSQRFQTDLSLHPFQIFSRLQEINPAPFAAYLDFPEISLISSSPERFLLLNSAREVETRPIKGTRPRSTDQVRDQKLAQELVESEKEKAENLMIVDLERNDLGKVAEIGSVKVKELFKVENYATVHHLVSIIKAQLRKDFGHFDLLQATFPGGSITGAPKVRAMEIIEELEPTKRGPYTGALGYLSFNSRMDLNIIIRTVIAKEGQAFFQVGGGIVADSQPELEYEETLHKGKALFKVLEG